MAAYGGTVHKDLREDFKHRVTVTATPESEDDQYDREGNPVEGTQTTGVPALWVEKVKTVVAPDGNGSIVAYVTVYLPHDMPVANGYKVQNEATGEERTAVSVRPPIYDDDESIPYTAWLE